MYTYESRIRYSELAPTGQLSLFALLNYFQDCSTFQSEDIGLGISYLAEKQLVWVLSAWQIVVERYPALGEKVVIGTFPYDFSRVIGYRNFLLRSENGEQLACANAIFTLLDATTGRPTRPNPEMLAGYTLAEKLPMEYADRKIALPADGLLLPSFTIRPMHLDTNNHVNNGQYVNLALDLLAGLDSERGETAPRVYRQLRAEYRKPALCGDVIYPYYFETKTETAKARIISLADVNKNPYAIMELR